MNYFYQAFGQNIVSEIELPELLPEPSKTPDITVRIQNLTPNPSPPSGEGNSHFDIPTIARFALPDTQNIHVYPEPGVSESDIRPFILGTALGILLHRKGYLVLHGNVIAHGDTCTAFVGPSGAGKSTLAGKYLKQGYQILSDDLCVIRFGEQIQVMPGYPQIKLWQDSADLLSISTQNLKHILGRENKFSVPIQEQFCAEPKILSKIFVLGELKPKLTALIQNTYRLGFLETPAERVRHLEQCQWIAKSIPITSLSHQVPLDDESCLKLLDLN